MPTNDDFDLASLFQGPGAVLAGVLGVADNARKTVGGVMETVASLQRAAGAVEALVTRMNRLVDDLEMPLRALTPEVEKTIARMQRVSVALEGPVDRLIPGLEAAIGAFDRVALSQLPETVDDARQQLQALLDLFSELPRRLGLLGGRSGLASLLPMNFLSDSKASRSASHEPGQAVSPPPRRGAARVAGTVRKSAGGNSAGGKTVAGKSAGGKSAAEKTGPKSSAVTKAVTKQRTVKKAAARKTVR